MTSNSLKQDFSVMTNRSPVYPSPNDYISLKELDIQRSNWEKFLYLKDNDLSEQWLWSYWLKTSKPSKIGKLFSKINASTKINQQKQIKALIRNVITTCCLR